MTVGVEVLVKVIVAVKVWVGSGVSVVVAVGVWVMVGVLVSVDVGSGVTVPEVVAGAVRVPLLPVGSVGSILPQSQARGMAAKAINKSTKMDRFMGPAFQGCLLMGPIILAYQNEKLVLADIIPFHFF